MVISQRPEPVVGLCECGELVYLEESFACYTCNKLYDILQAGGELHGQKKTIQVQNT